MLIGIAYMLQVIKINEKVPVELFYNNHHYIAYIIKNKSFNPSSNEVIEIDTANKKKLIFKVKTVTEESSFTRLELTTEINKNSIDCIFDGNTKLYGYICVHTIKLWDLIFS